MSSGTRGSFLPLTDSTHARNRRTDSSKPAKPLLWVGYQQDSLLNGKLAGEKQAFLKRELFRSKKGTRPQKIKHSTKSLPIRPELDEHDTAPTLCSSLEIGILDTFPSLSGIPRHNVNKYFLFFKDSIAPSGQPFSANQMTLWYYQKSADQPVVIESLATIGAASLAIQHSMNGFTSREVYDYHQDSLNLQARALRSLRAIVERPSNGSLQMAILSIGLLIYVGGYFEKGRGILPHLNGLKRIIHTLGGYDKVDHLTLSEIYCCELTASLMNNFRLPFDMDPGWEKKVEEDFSLLVVKSLPKYSRVGNRFLTSSWSSDLPQELRSIIIALRFLILDFETLGEANPRDSSVKNNRLTLCARQLIGLPSSCSITPFHDILRLTILLYCVIRVWSIPSKPWISMITEKLLPALETELTTLERTAPDLLLWVLFMVGSCTHGLEYHAWFVMRLEKTARLLHLQDWESVLPKLEGFFFIARSVNDPARLFWSSEIQPGLMGFPSRD